jgi:glutamine synthetase
VAARKTHPLHGFDEGTFTDGLGFDGSSITRLEEHRQQRHAADPDARTAFIDPL